MFFSTLFLFLRIYGTLVVLHTALKNRSYDIKIKFYLFEPRNLNIILYFQLME